MPYHPDEDIIWCQVCDRESKSNAWGECLVCGTNYQEESE